MRAIRSYFCRRMEELLGQKTPADEIERQLMQEIAILDPAIELEAKNRYLSTADIFSAIGIDLASLNLGAQEQTYINVRLGKILRADPAFINNNFVPISLIQKNADSIRGLLPQSGTEWLLASQVPWETIQNTMQEMLRDESCKDCWGKISAFLSNRESRRYQILNCLNIEQKRHKITRYVIMIAVRNAFSGGPSGPGGLTPRQRAKSGHVQS